MFAWNVVNSENLCSCMFSSLLSSPMKASIWSSKEFAPDYLLSVLIVVVALGTWVEHKPNGNSVRVCGPVVLLHHMKIFHGSSVLVYSVLASRG